MKGERKKLRRELGGLKLCIVMGLPMKANGWETDGTEKESGHQTEETNTRALSKRAREKDWVNTAGPTALPFSENGKKITSQAWA